AGAVEAFGEDAGDGGLARAARAAKEIGVRDAFLLDGVAQRLRDVFLADDVSESLRAILAGYDLIGHLRFTIYDLRVAVDCLGNRNSNIVNRMSECQGDHGRSRANYCFCFPAMAVFISPQSMVPGGRNCG